MTIRQQGGVFGRNPTFHDVEADLLDLNGPLQVDATGSYFQMPTSTNARAFYLKQSNDYGYSFNLDTQSTGDLMIKSVNNGVETDLIKASRVSGHVTIANNLIISNAGSGIDFSATAGTGTSELFDDYEEGTWTPTLTNLTVGNGSYVRAFYTKIGRLVHISFDFTFGSTTVATGGDIEVSGLPFAAAGSGHGSGYFLDSGTGQYTVPAVLPTSSNPNALIAASANAFDQSITNTKPFTWAVNDRINFAMTYITS
jgi:hypothetical protein